MKKLTITLIIALFSVSLFALPNGRYYWCNDITAITYIYDINGNVVDLTWGIGCDTDYDAGCYGSFVVAAGIRHDLPVSEVVIKSFIERNTASLGQQ